MEGLGCLVGLGILAFIVYCFWPLGLALLVDGLMRSHRTAKIESQRQAILAQQQQAIQEFNHRIDLARQGLVRQKAVSKLWLLDTMSNLLQPIHYTGGIEGAVCLYLDSLNVVLDVEHWVGDACSVSMPPETILEHARSLGASGVAIAHNHPNNSSTPSDQDVWCSAGLKEMLQVEGIRLIEAYVWCHGQYKSVLNTRRFKELSNTIRH